MENNYPNVQERYEDEIDLVEIIKILLKNIKFIILLTTLVTVLGIITGIYMKKIEPITLEQNFSLSDYSKVGIKNLNPGEIFKNNQVVEEFYKEKIFIKEENENILLKEKRKNLEEIYVITNTEKNTLNYKVSVSSETEEESKELIAIFFKTLNSFIESQNKTELKEKILLVDTKINEYTSELEKMEDEIDKISSEYSDLIGVNTSVSDVVEAMKEKRPIVFAKKETYTTMYNESLREKLEIERTISSLTNNINIRTSVYEVEGKVRLSIVGIISLLLGGCLSLILVFLKEFIKKTNWN